jgi:hypothetical protein
MALLHRTSWKQQIVTTIPSKLRKSARLPGAS